MATIKSFTTLEQSKKLAEILPIESADMYYFLDPTPAGNIYHLVVQRVDVGIKNIPQYNEGDIPCWSLAALLDILPDRTCVYKKTYKDGRVKYQGIAEGIKELILRDNPIDACVAMIEKLHELNLL